MFVHKEENGRWGDTAWIRSVCVELMYNSWEPGSRCVVASRIKNSVRYYSIYCNIQFYLQYCTVSVPWVQQKKTKHSFSCWVFSNHGHSHGLVPQQSVLLDFMSPSEDSGSHQHTNHLASLKSSSLYICRYKLWHANHCFGWKTKEKYCLSCHYRNRW